MFLTRLVYASTMTDAFNCDDIEGILGAARKNNSGNSITGMLCFNRKYFMQCLEGSRADVNETYQRILKDERHSNVVLLDYKEIDAREFDHWSMGYLPESSLTCPTILKYSVTAEFNPYEMSGESAHLMMVELRRVAPTAS